MINKKILIGILGFEILGFIAVGYYFFTFQAANNTLSLSRKMSSRTTAPIPGQGTRYIEGSRALATKSATVLQQDAGIIDFIRQLPYQGKSSSLRYNYNALQFYLRISTQQRKQGENEFEQLLLKHKIDKASLGRIVYEYY